VVMVGLVLLAKRLLPRTGLLWFALLLAVSDRLLWHACEAKPYAIDVLVATGLLALMLAKSTVATTEARHLQRLLLMLTLLSPVLIFLSFPACFLIGGAALTLFAEVWRRRCRRTWALYVLFGTVLCGAFLALYFTAVRAQRDAQIVDCWAHVEHKLPSWDRPWLVGPEAVLRVLEVFRYAAEPVGNLLVFLAVVGAIHWWRQGQRQLLGILLWPLALNVVAWLLGAYPLGAVRVVVYAAPAALLLIAAGIAPTLTWLSSRWGRLPKAALAGLLLVPAVTTLVLLVRPWTKLDSATPAAFVLEHRRVDEPVVGTRWEQAYYFRELGTLYRSLTTVGTEPPTLPSAAAQTAHGQPTGRAVTSLWLMGEVINPAERHEAYLMLLRPAGRWRIVAEYPFRDVTVLHVQRQGAP